MKTYRVAIVGLGRMGSTLDQSIASASHVSERLQVVAGAETIPERRTAFQEKWDVETVYEDYQEMIEKEQPDLVGVCTTATGLPKPGNRAPSTAFRGRCTRRYGSLCSERWCADALCRKGNLLFRAEG